MKKILIVDDDKVSLATAKGVLGDDYKVFAVLDGSQALKFLEKNECDLILLDINMPGMNGFEVMEKIMESKKSKDIPVIFLTSDNEAATETRCFEVGARDFISKPFVPTVIRSRVNRTLELEELRANLADRLDKKTQEAEEIKVKSFTDALTGLWNREYTEAKVDELLNQGDSGALLMIDLDNFKAINDNYGHQEGDRVLNIFADTLREFSSEGDVICRIGGDEFVAFLTNKRRRPEIGNIAGDMIEYLNKQISELNYDVKTSVSIGIALAGVDGDNFAKLYNCGDKALYYVKNNGKNFYRFYSDNVQEEQSRATRNVDLQYLGEILSRSDSGRGAYMLDFESFHHIYNFIKRFVERTNSDVASVLFTLVSVDGSPIDSDAAVQALEKLDEAIFTSLRRVDISTRYSSVQTMVLLLDASPDNAEIVINRILNQYNDMHHDESLRIEYSFAEIKSRSNRRKDDA